MRKRRNSGRRGLALILASLLLMLSACGGSRSAAGNGGKEETQGTSDEAARWTAQETLKGINAGEISSITYTISTEGGQQEGEITDPKEIEEVYLRLMDVRLKEASSQGVDDDGLRLIVEAPSDSLSFEFEGKILVLSKDERYEVEELSSLKSYVKGLADLD